MKRNLLSLSAIALALALAVSFLPAAHPARATSPGVVISQIYGAGGNSGALLNHDYVELFNRGTTSVSLSGLSIQYASATGTGNFSANPVALLSGTLAPGQYYLVQLAGGTNGSPLPAADASGTINMSATGGKVALVNGLTGLACNGSSTPCTPAQLAQIVDLVGLDGANFYETAAAPATSTVLADFRSAAGCVDSDNNAADFSAATPAPRNSASPFNYCSGPTSPTGTGASNPGAVFAGDPLLLTVTVTPGANPPSSGVSVACDLSSIGGAAAQAFYDDGTNGDAAAGDNTFSFATSVAAATVGGPKSLGCSLGDAQGRSGSATLALTVTAILPIGTVNGAVLDGTDGTTHTSPYVGQTVTVKGVIYEKTLQAITNSTNTYKGFFIQNTAATADGDPTTSDGLFVFMSTGSTLPGPGGPYTPSVGDEIVLTGKISEYYNMTELGSPTLALPVVRSGVDIDAEVAPVVADPPASLADANRYWERLQGMRIQVPSGSIVLGGRNVFSPADAEIWVAAPTSTVAGRSDPSTDRAFRDAHPLDDNYDASNWDGNGYRILMGSLGIKALSGDGQALIDPARTFDTVTSAPAGGLNYTFSKYRVEIAGQPVFAEGPDPSANYAPEAFDRTFAYSIVDYNLENLYDYRDNPFSGCDFTGNAGCSNSGTPYIAAVTPPYDYIPDSDAAYQARLNDIAQEILNDLHAPDILMVQEVENQDICSVSGSDLVCGTTDNADGKPDVLQELALKIASLGGPAYDAAFDRNSSDLRGIAPAFLYRTDRVELLPAAGDPLLGTNPAIPGYTSVPYDADVSNPKTLNAVLPAGISACETNWVFPRAPDIGLFRIWSLSLGAGSHRDVYVIDNHFKSGPDTCVAHRTEQAKYNAALVAFLEAANPAARIVVGGDLNVYPRPDDPFAPLGTSGSSDQLAALYDPALGLKNLWEVLLSQAPQAAYSYVYLGQAQTIDQMFVNPAMLSDLEQFRSAHINSDFPADYPGDVARGTSDHDPQYAVFNLNDPPVVDAGEPYSVDEGASVVVTASATDTDGGPLSYAWDLDHNGTFETPGQSVAFQGLDGPAVQTIAVQVTDSGGLSTVATTTVTINNVAPTASLGNGGPVNEGSPVTVSFSGAADPSAADLASLHYVIACDGGLLTGFTYATASDSPTFTCSFDDGPSTHSVRGRVIDKDEGFTEYTTDVNVNNVAPTATLNAPTLLNEGDAFTLSLSGAMDPSSADTAAGFLYAFDCGTGYAASGSTSTANCSALDNPAQSVHARIQDKDGGVSEYSATITVLNVAPSVGPITAPTAPLAVKTAFTASASFTDPGILDTHIVVWDWGDGTTSNGTISESGGSGSASGSHSYPKAGIYKLTLTVTDKDGAAGQVTFQSVIVYDPNAGWVTAGGWFDSPAGAYLPNPTWKGKAFFDFEVRYKHGAAVPSGKVNFHLLLKGLDFESTGFDWMILNTQPGWMCWWIFNRCSADIQIHGTGTVNGNAGYQFMIWAADNRPDTLRIRIWSQGAGGTENVLYDNLSEERIGGGSINVIR